MTDRKRIEKLRQEIGDLDLISQLDLARMLSVSPGTVGNWRKRNLGFPEPVIDHGSAVLFLSVEIAAWLRQRHAPLLAFLEAHPA